MASLSNTPHKLVDRSESGSARVGLEFRSFGFRVSEFWVLGLGFRVEGFRVLGLEFRSFGFRL